MMDNVMQIYENQTFDGFDDRDSGNTFEGFEFRQCQFDGCHVSITEKPELRSTLRDIHLIDCSENGGGIGKAIVEDCVVENLRTPGVFQVFGAAFKHVVLRGKLSDLMINNECLPDFWVNPPYQYENVEAFRVANEEYYSHVDWALDISKGEFKDLDIRGIPSRLIRRDPETQVVVSRQRLLDGEDWQGLEFKAAPCFVAFKLLLDSDDEDTIIVAPKRHRRFREYMADLQLLRDAGIANQD